MYPKKEYSIDFAGRKLIVEIGKFAQQATASCLVRYEGTSVLVTAVLGEKREGVDFFPLTVDYDEKMYAAGKIKGSRWVKKEGQPTDEAILTGRVIDRSIRPLFDENMRRDVQVVATVLEYDGENDPSFVALMGASIALSISKIPWDGPAAGFSIGRINGELVLNPTFSAQEKSDYEVFVTGTIHGIDMIEARCKENQESEVFEAIEFANKHIKKLIEFVIAIQKEIGAEKISTEEKTEEIISLEQMINQKLEDFFKEKDVKIIFDPDKNKTKENIKKLSDELNEILKVDNEVSKDARAFALRRLDETLTEKAREMILRDKIRPDRRKVDEIREISCEVGLFNRTHGTGLFQRGETQVLSIVTLGAPGEEQLLDGMEIGGKKRYMHHYNFPGFSVGEVSMKRGNSRREIGHGALAENALIPVLPDKEEFPYTIRVVSEVLGSNGSSSQASACGSTLALMDAGVPIKKPVAGIAMGLITSKDKKDYVILTDIQGVEDHSGDMDFKVAGTRDGITAIQLDIKLGGITLEQIRETLDKAKIARLQILDIMANTISEPRKELSQYAPRVISLTIDPEQIREVIGAGGKTINKIVETYGVQIDIDQSGIVFVTAIDQKSSDDAIEFIKNMLKKVQVGEIYDGKVTQILKDQRGGEIGAIVEILPGKDGMVHVSEIKHERVERVSDFLHEGDNVKVKVIDVDEERGRTSLSIKALIPNTNPERSYNDRNSFHRNDRNDKKGSFFGHKKRF